MRRFKTFGLFFLAVFAMSAVAASIVRAETETASFSWAQGTTKLVGETDPTEPTQILTLLNGKLETTCNEGSGESAVSGTGASTVSVENIFKADTGLTPTKNLCTTNISGANASFRLNGCGGELHAGTTISSAPNGESEGTATIVCPVGKEIETEATGCLIRIPGGQTVGPIYYRTVKTGAKEEVTGEAYIGLKPLAPHNRAVTYSSSKALCGVHNNETNGTYLGKGTVVGLDVNGNQTDVTIT